MLSFEIYFALLTLCWIYALLRGGAPERIGTTILGIASALSMAAASSPAGRFGSVEFGVFLVDVACLIAFMILALRAERFWPLWITALQIVGTAGHAVKLIEPEVIRSAYAFILAFWSYPMLLLLVLGTWSHQRRLARNGADPSWSTFSSRSVTPRGAGP